MALKDRILTPVMYLVCYSDGTQVSTDNVSPKYTGKTADDIILCYWRDPDEFHPHRILRWIDNGWSSDQDDDIIDWFSNMNYPIEELLNTEEKFIAFKLKWL